MKILDEKGATLYELLAVMVILMIVLPVIYGVFSSGYKLYNKVNAEGQLRDDADYTATMIMNAFYSTPFDYVRSCGDNCIELVDSEHTTVALEEGEQQSFYSIDQSSVYEEEKVTVIQLTDKTMNNQTISVFEIDGAALDVQSDFSNSTITGCEGGPCENGIIQLHFNLSHKRLAEGNLELDSQFGF
ncbi:PilW family protein [Cytobacillus gottheilii]|uniref:Prepilin-type N-terminal cleavage/methylation domain-containing protein n=1 Tax=Cytobacillus gottheilii TaxID=859144 RepID=A0ABX8FAQ0_9BACI|nr:hypothetical protein [Cytobacillus gottheilii]QVY60551.1 hypothetical protein J1899_16255 [Cytobacillus gottheilii]